MFGLGVDIIHPEADAAPPRLVARAGVEDRVTIPIVARTGVALLAVPSFE